MQHPGRDSQALGREGRQFFDNEFTRHHFGLEATSDRKQRSEPHGHPRCSLEITPFLISDLSQFGVRLLKEAESREPEIGDSNPAFAMGPAQDPGRDPTRSLRISGPKYPRGGHVRGRAEKIQDHHRQISVLYLRLGTGRPSGEF